MTAINNGTTIWRSNSSKLGNNDTKNYHMIPNVYAHTGNGKITYVLRGITSHAITNDTWPPKDWEKMCCRNCSGPLSLCKGQPFVIPTDYDVKTKTYHLSHILVHHPACAGRYLIDRASSIYSAKIAVMWRFAKDVFNLEYYGPALVLDELEVYGGMMSHATYYKHGCSENGEKLTLSKPVDMHLVPIYVVNEMIESAENGNHKELAFEDPSRVSWSVKNLKRPAHLPPTPVVRLTPGDAPTIYDKFIDKKKTTTTPKEIKPQNEKRKQNNIINYMPKKVKITPLKSNRK
jgi:hypothetical protein